MITRCICCAGDDVRVEKIVEDPAPEVNPAVIHTRCADCGWTDEASLEDLAAVAGDPLEKVDIGGLPW